MRTLKSFINLLKRQNIVWFKIQQLKRLCHQLDFFSRQSSICDSFRLERNVPLFLESLVSRLQNLKILLNIFTTSSENLWLCFNCVFARLLWWPSFCCWIQLIGGMLMHFKWTIMVLDIWFASYLHNSRGVWGTKRDFSINKYKWYIMSKQTSFSVIIELCAYIYTESLENMIFSKGKKE